MKELGIQELGIFGRLIQINDMIPYDTMIESAIDREKMIEGRHDTSGMIVTVVMFDILKYLKIILYLDFARVFIYSPECQFCCGRVANRRK